MIALKIWEKIGLTVVCVFVALCFYCVSILQYVSRVAHVNDCVEDLREDWSDGGVHVCGSVFLLYVYIAGSKSYSACE